MIMKNFFWTFIGFILLNQTLLAAQEAKYTREPGACFPASSIYYQTGNKSLNGLLEAEFDQIIANALKVLTPEVKKRLNKTLIIDKRWNDGTVDAYATRDTQNNPVIVMNGGLARHPLMTRDAFLLLICHEVGHHLGGAPKIFRGNSGLRGWSSAEGQADYFATSKCLPLFFKSQMESKSFDIDLDSDAYKVALSYCRDNTCARVALAGLSASKVFSSLVIGTPEPKLTGNDKTIVSKTYYNHPNPQCRLDTYRSGANCESEIPFDSIDAKIGACVKDEEARPTCWFQEKDY